MLKLVVLDTDGERRIVKFENWALKFDNKVTFRTCISTDLGKQFWESYFLTERMKHS